MHAALGASFAIEGGWDVPTAYGKDDGARFGVLAVADITAKGKIDVRGEVSALVDGLSGAQVARISDVWAFVLTPPGGGEPLAAELEAKAGSSAMVTDATHLYAGYALAGPRAHDLTAELTAFDVSTVGEGQGVGATFAATRSVMIRREPEGGGSVLEVYVPSELGRFVWETITDVAGALGGGPVGWDALRAWGWNP
jgi:glycine cleavage system aminomethyltransferase T